MLTGAPFGVNLFVPAGALACPGVKTPKSASSAGRILAAWPGSSPRRGPGSPSGTRQLRRRERYCDGNGDSTTGRSGFSRPVLRVGSQARCVADPRRHLPRHHDSSIADLRSRARVHSHTQQHSPGPGNLRHLRRPGPSPGLAAGGDRRWQCAGTCACRSSYRGSSAPPAVLGTRPQRTRSNRARPRWRPVPGQRSPTGAVQEPQTSRSRCADGRTARRDRAGSAATGFGVFRHQAWVRRL